MFLTFRMLDDGDRFLLDGVKHIKQREWHYNGYNAAVQDDSFDYDNGNPFVRLDQETNVKRV